jgi:hypothetical protein
LLGKRGESEGHAQSPDEKYDGFFGMWKFAAKKAE